MVDPQHLRNLEKMYGRARINEIYEPVISISAEETNIEIALSDKYFHAGGAIHGSVYFKMLDDAAYFAASALEPEFFMLTASFTTYITRPVSSGILRSTGRTVNSTKSQFIVEAIAYDSEDREVARGNGIFMRSKMLLSSVADYTD